ncbi:unnamed protein product [Rhizophagus irregularis]|uniref:Uncharacterized protein n=1 Tax=Rhizophagus irregularis TaxID=588596 RepID=A0A915ZQ81_9GLOM|nr:unnamed protein product [Rhizophagus irregularis]
MQNSDFEGAPSGCRPVVIRGIQIKDEKTDKSFWQYIEDTQKLELLRERQVINLALKVIGLKSENESYLSEANLRTCDTEILTIITRKFHHEIDGSIHESLHRSPRGSPHEVSLGQIVVLATIRNDPE